MRLIGGNQSHRKREKTALSDKTKETVKAFVMYSEVSKEVPDKRSVTKVKESSKVTLVQRHNMSLTLSDVYMKRLLRNIHWLKYDSLLSANFTLPSN